MTGRVPLLMTLALLGSLARPGEPSAVAASSERLPIRDRVQTLRLYGTRGGPVAIVTSGDGGWVHLGPAVAQYLASQGWFVVGFDAKAYLASFTGGSATLSAGDVPKDYATLVDYSARGAAARPLLVGVSVGAGLSVLAATAPEMQVRIAGVLALGLPEQNELGWRFRDSTIYVTKKAPNEPSFSARDVVARVSPVPLALLRSTHDEFVTPAESDAIWARTREPRRLWSIEAADHRFSDNQPELQRRLKEAIAWITQPKAGSR
jgi:dienelactone hydrolase